MGTSMRVVRVIAPQPTESEEIVWEWDRKQGKGPHRGADTFSLKLIKPLNSRRAKILCGNGSESGAADRTVKLTRSP